MQTSDILIRMAWLVEHVHDNKGISKERIFKDWERSSFSENGSMLFGRSTFFTDLQTIERVFGIQIKFDTELNGYVIKNTDTLFSNKIQRWFLRSLQAGNHARECLGLYDRFLTDEFPSEGGKLHIITCAMQMNNKLQIRYHKYDGTLKEHLLEPYCIKVYKHRFYMLGRLFNGNFCIFALDRMSDIAISEQTFEMDSGFSTEDFFYYHYGVFLTDHSIKPDKIIIRTYGDARYYLRDVPIHHTQVELSSCKDYADFELTLYPTNDFLGDILQQGKRFEIIYPLHVRQKIFDAVSGVYNLYAEQAVA